MADHKPLVEAFTKKFNAQVVVPWDGSAQQVDIGPTRVTLASNVRQVLPGSDFLIRLKSIPEIMKRDVWDIPALRSSGLIEPQVSRTVPVGAYRPMGKKPKIIYPTGILSVDLALSGGFMGSILSRIWGASTGGKSVILYMAMITAWQLYGKKSLLINPEFDFDEDRFSVLPGGKTMLESEGLLVYDPGASADAYDKVIDLVGSAAYAIIGFDSLTPLKSESELSKSFSDEPRVADKAKAQTRFLEDVLPHLYHKSKSALIMIVQSRKRLGDTRSGMMSQFDEVSGSYGASGDKPASGDALQFYTQQSLKVFPPTKLVYEKGTRNILGHQITGLVDKNKRAPQGTRFGFYIDYRTGLDLDLQIVNAAIEAGIIELRKQKHVVQLDGQEQIFDSGRECRLALSADRELRKAVYLGVLKHVNPDFRI